MGSSILNAEQSNLSEPVYITTMVPAPQLGQAGWLAEPSMAFVTWPTTSLVTALETF